MEKVNKLLNNVIKNKDVVIISCSGGPDSMCLLSIMLKFKHEKDLTIICAHVNHKKRKQSEEEEKYVKNFCKEQNIKFELLELTNYDDNFQADARKQRYKFLKELKEKYKASIVMTAHHGDDLIETILMRISRGSNLSGYTGFKTIDEYNEYKIIKPLIYLNKEDILEYNKNNSIKYYIDDSNFEDDYTRNRYRKNILSFLKSENKKIHEKYLIFNEKLSSYDKFVKEYIEKQQIVNNNKINLIKFKEENEFIKDRVIEKVISDIQEKDNFCVNDNIIKEINKLINSTEGKGTIDLPNKYKGIKEKKEFYIKNTKL